MKIAIVLNTSWNIFNFRRGIIKEFLRQGHEVLAIAPRDQFSTRLEELGCRFIPIKMDSRGINPFRNLALFFELWLIYRRCSPDVILHYTVKPNLFGSLAAGFLGIPSIANVCGLGTLFLNPGPATFIAMQLYRLAFRFPFRVLFQNQDDEKFFVSNRLIHPSKCQSVPGSGVDLELYRPSPHSKGPETHFLMVARLILDKGVKEFINAAHAFSEKGYNAKFTLAGQLDSDHKRGISKAKLKEWLDWSGVKYAGFQQNIKELIADADIVVLPSYREGTPKSLLEAAACGKPIVCTDVPGCNQVVRQGFNGFLCKPKTSEDLFRAMENFYHLELSEQRQMGRNSRTMAEARFDEKLVVSIYSGLILDLNHQSGMVEALFQGIQVTEN